MRQRHIVHDEETDVVPVSRPIARRLAEADLFPKPREDYQRKQTKYGAVVSLVTIVIMTLLVLWEGIAYLRGRDAYDTDVTIDASSSDDMQVNLDVLFPNLPCNRLSIDVIDATGTWQFDYSGAVHKLPCGIDRLSMYKGNQQDLELAGANQKNKEGKMCKKCPSALFREFPESWRASLQSICCNTCESVLAIFNETGKPAPNIEYIPQCLEQLSVRGRGCNVVGSLDLKKVPVTVVLGPRRTGAKYAFHDFIRLDTSHKINKLRIGNESVERFSENGIAEPLTGHESFATTYLETRYYVKVVPTTYRTKKSQDLKASTYEYSAQWSSRPIIPGMSGQVPAVLISFEPSALQVNNIFQRPPFTHFLVQLCGIVGGIFVILGFLDRCVEWCVTHMSST
ncbi:hypothetical protein ABB37_07276 [Leptomonas pyrrhocoris]|uniref:Uncharacterized protein n=1 Tax=Leptomonas pyrrhocoris TaxID=157538 RepID=A0A0M9FVK2_LEPPY|nr:hypothetical protein ABB37_07276 [Leptomonas pyrrhocoris]KPA76883.1 hypothetical protein ABB37_07276 [Leptomonas pyrrhocoris]|eukprot:XP_015655322.1 hypothetical protein ABB37_07276 [Leptomonas pyrrhocoris]